MYDCITPVASFASQSMHGTVSGGNNNNKQHANFQQYQLCETFQFFHFNGWRKNYRKKRSNMTIKIPCVCRTQHYQRPELVVHCTLFAVLVTRTMVKVYCEKYRRWWKTREEENEYPCAITMYAVWCSCALVTCKLGGQKNTGGHFLKQGIP